MSSLGCARCGNCCDPVHLSADQRMKVDHWREHVAGGGEPPEPGYDLAFILKHWTETDRDEANSWYRCDRFDPETRTCTAHDDRPPVCSGFPFYGHPGDPRNLDQREGARCSFWLDVPPDRRPAGVRPLIPLEVIR